MRLLWLTCQWRFLVKFALNKFLFKCKLFFYFINTTIFNSYLKTFNQCKLIKKITIVFFFICRHMFTPFHCPIMIRYLLLPIL